MANPIPPSTPAVDVPDKDSGLDIVFAETKERMRDQEERIANLSENARFVLTAASLLVAGFSGLLGMIVGLDSSNQGNPLPFDEWTAIPTLVIYLILVVCAVQGFKPRNFSACPAPSGLGDYLDSGPDETKRDIFWAMAASYDRNAGEVSRKAMWVSLAQWALAAEVTWLIVLIVKRAFG